MLTAVTRRPVDWPALRWLMVTGEAVPPGLTRRWFAISDVPMVNAYGPTEASDDVTHHVLTGPVDADRVPVGRPIINTRLYVVGADDRLLPIGSFGEICVTGLGVGLGYVRDPARTAAAFRPNGFDDASSTLYRTGDVGRWLPDGTLDCAGRVDDQVKVRGHRIELTEIEGALSRLTGVEQAAVVVTERGGARTLAAWYTGAAGADPAEVRRRLAERLPGYLLPDTLARLDALPLTGNGKVDRAALARRTPPRDEARPPEPPADEVESRVREAFAATLGVPAEQVPATANFFELGGHSLAAMRVVAELAVPGRAALTLVDLLAEPTVRGVAGRLRGGRAGRPGTGLTDVSRAAGHEVLEPSATLVCVPYAGGRAAGYVPLALAVRAADESVRVLAVDTRGPDPAAELAEAIVGLDGPVWLLGHSSGAASAFAAAALLRRRGRPVDHLLVVAAAPTVTGHAPVDVGALPAGERDQVSRAYRADAAAARRIYAEALRRPDRHRLDAPVTVVLAPDDDIAGDPGYWRRFTDSVSVVWSDGGGHYLNTTRPQFLAEQIVGRYLADTRPAFLADQAVATADGQANRRTW
jgi:surfactin synthase thioesterase subunit